MQVIGTEAQGDATHLRELSEKARVAEVSAGVSSLPFAAPVTSQVQISPVEPLASKSAPAVDLAPATDQSAAPEQNAAPVPSPEAGAAAEVKDVAGSPCTPDGSGAPFCTYVVQDGDTLSTIAEALGLEGTAAFSAAELIALSNGLNDAQNWLILVGQELRVPVESGVIHTVSESETISVLADLYGVSIADIVVANSLADVNSVVVGATLLVPSPNLWPWSGPATAVAETPTEAPADIETPDAEGTEASPTAEATEEATETPEASALAATSAPAASANANPSVTEVRDLFAKGYIAGGGPPQYLETILQVVIPCESGYNLRAFNPAGPFYGLMQFLPQTWANTGGGDWFDAWQQGHNTGVLLQVSSPTTQWPSCWR